MNHQNSRFAPGALLLASVLLLPITPTEAAPALESATYNELEAAQQQMQQGRFDSALRAMSQLLQDTDRDYDRAVILQTMGYAHVDKKNYNAAVDAFEQALALEQLPEQPTLQVRRALGRLYAVTDKPAKARQVLEQWLAASESPSAEDYAAIADVYSKLEAYSEAIDAIRKAIRLQQQPNASYYQLLIAMYFESKRYGEAAGVLEKLIARSPENKQYWTQLTNIYLNTDQTGKAHGTLQLAYRKGLLQQESELLNLVQVGLAAGLPDQAARVLEKELQAGRIASTRTHWELLAQAWTRAKETKNAIAAYDQVAEFSQTGEYQLRQAQLYVQENEWDSVAAAARKAIDRGGLDSPGQAYLLLGMAHVRQQQHAEAIAAFGKAKQYDATASQAGKWVTYARQRQEQQS